MSAFEQGQTSLLHVEDLSKAFYASHAVSPIHPVTLRASHAFDEPLVWGKIDPKLVPFVGTGKEANRVAAESKALLRFAATCYPGWSAYSSAVPKSRVFGPTGAPLEDVDSAVLTASEGVERQ